MHGGGSYASCSGVPLDPEGPDKHTDFQGGLMFPQNRPAYVTSLIKVYHPGRPGPNFIELLSTKI